MSNIRIWYNKNRVTIWTAILIIVILITLIQTLDKHYEEKPKENNNISTTYNKTDTYSVITKKEINKKTAKESVDLIDRFIGYCNNKQFEQAYNLLSTNCKEEFYPTIEEFKIKYYNKIFTEKKSYNSMLWIASSIGNTYRVEIMRDLLATGEKDEMPIEDYYTIIIENEQYKLNISRYISKENINVTKEQEDIIVTVVSKIQHMDYEKYKINIQNNTGANLVFNKKEKTNSIYIQDENDVKYTAFLNEITDSQLNVPSGASKTLEIKFNRGYKPTIEIEKILFEDIYSNEKTKIIEIEI